MTPKLKITGDGSHTVYVPEIDECYHSTHGSIQESKHIFIDTGVHSCKKDKIKVLEVGFGTGLNAFLTLLEAKKNNQKVEYTALELFPIKIEDVILLNYPELLEKSERKNFERIHTSAWNRWVEITPHFKLKKINEDFTKIKLDEKFDVIYFDAFSPEKQPEMWTMEMFNKLFCCSETGGVLTTYCCKGDVKRALKSAGFKVEKIPGPIGKREILRAIKYS